MRPLAVLALAALTSRAVADIPTVPLWTAYTGWPTCYRQPFLVKTESRLLAFVEGRPGIPWCSGTFYPTSPDFPILMRASADDGASWEPTVVNITRGNLDFLNAVYDSTTKVVHLLIQEGDSTTLQTSSKDEGRTWTPAVPINIGGLPAGMLIIPGVGHGIQITNAGHRCVEPTCGGTVNRLVIPFVATLAGPVANDTACGNCATALVLSDDHGASWRIGAVSAQAGSREAAIVQLDARGSESGAVLYVSERNLGNATGVRLHAVSNNGGASFATYARDDTLPDVITSNWTGVVAGLARFDSPRIRYPLLIFSTPHAPHERADLRLWSSHDDGRAWTPSGSVWSGPAAYSDLLQINDTHVGVVFEGSTEEFAGGIRFGAYAVQ